MPRLTEKEQQEIIRFIEAGKPLPEQYRFVLFDEKPEAEERFRLITESIYDCVSLVDTSGVYRYVSPSYRKTLGYDPEELIGRNGFSITHPDDLERILKLYVERMEKSYNEIKYETRLLHRDGHYVPMEVTALAINSPQGKLTGRVLVARDITERKQAEEALQRQLRYEQSIALASTCLLNYEDAPHKTVHDAIACLREAMDVSRAYIFENSDDAAAGLCASLTHESCAPGVPPGIDNPLLQQMPYSSGMERWRELLSNKKPVWGDVCDFPESERANLEPQGIISIMVLPLFSGGRWHGFVGFDETLKQRKWEAADVALLKTAADMIGIFMAHMRTQEALRESQERYYGVYETAPIAFVLWDRARHITDWNRHAEKTFGWSREEALGRNFFDLILPESARASVEDVVTRLLEGLMPSRSINENIKKDGSIILCEWNNAIQYDSRGEVVGVLSLALDITERKQAEEALQASEEKYRSILEKIEDGYFEVDMAGNFTFFNDSMCRILGYSREELMGMNYRKYTDPAHAKKVLREYNQVYRTGKSLKAFDWEYVKKDGEKCYLDTSVSLIKDSKGEAVGFRGIARDITERKKVESERYTLQSQLNQAQKMESVGRLAGGVAHDFNNKLTIINGYAEMAIEMVEPSNPLYKPFREILTAGIKSAAIVRQLLAFARKQTISPVQLDLNDTISNMLKMLQRLIGENIDLAWHPGKNLWSVKTDPSQVDQIILNLAVNARDAMSDVGKLTIETKNTVVDEDYCKTNPEANPGRYVMLSVTDDGSGMDKETLGNLFEPFFTTKEIGKGTGLGLATIYGIVKQNYGFINVYSEPGTGTTFKIYLPRHEGEELSLKSAIRSSGQVPTGTETILVVEDEKSVLHMARQILERLGYTVQIAENPYEALKLSEAYEGTIHLLLTDVVMPEMNGRDLSSQMTMIRPGLKTLYMSGYTANAIVHHGVLDPGVLFIHKPLSMQELAVKVREAIEQG